MRGTLTVVILTLLVSVANAAWLGLGRRQHIGTIPDHQGRFFGRPTMADSFKYDGFRISVFVYADNSVTISHSRIDTKRHPILWVDEGEAHELYPSSDPGSPHRFSRTDATRFIEQMKAGRQLKIRFWTSDQRQVDGVISLVGFTKTHNYIMQEKQAIDQQNQEIEQQRKRDLEQSEIRVWNKIREGLTSMVRSIRQLLK